MNWSHVRSIGSFRQASASRAASFCFMSRISPSNCMTAALVLAACSSSARVASRKYQADCGSVEAGSENGEGGKSVGLICAGMEDEHSIPANKIVMILFIRNLKKECIFMVARLGW